MSVSLRLTAFVAKSFTSAQEFIYIEPKQIKEAHSWLFTTQKPDGCFLTVGKLFNNRMKVRIPETRDPGGVRVGWDGVGWDALLHHATHCLHRVEWTMT